MQGRLSRQTERGYQAFPWETWQLEFELASQRRFEHIEWVLDSYRWSENPLIKNPALVNQAIESSRVSVASVCADFLMDTPLSTKGTELWKSFELLLSAMKVVSAEVVVIPCVDQSTLLDERNYWQLVEILPHAIDLASQLSITVALETDLAPEDFGFLLEQFDSPALTVNYDSGNSAALGYDFRSEMSAYGERISDFHLKDRTLAGPSVQLGTGDADLESAVGHIKESNFQGLVTLQAMRDGEGLKILDKQLAILHELIHTGS